MSCIAMKFSTETGSGVGSGAINDFAMVFDDVIGGRAVGGGGGNGDTSYMGTFFERERRTSKMTSRTRTTNPRLAPTALPTVVAALELVDVVVVVQEIPSESSWYPLLHEHSFVFAELVWQIC